MRNPFCFELFILPVIVMLACVLYQPDTSQEAKPRKIDFNQDIKPILSDHCFACHGPDEKARKADLRLDTREGLFGKSASDSSIVTGNKPEESLLLDRIFTESKSKLMPPAKHNKPLTPEQKKLIQEWVKQGASWSNHWSFDPPTKTTIPTALVAGWTQNPIDAFILAKLKEKGLEHSPPATKGQLLRRVYLDLTGLPPTPVELDAFLKDNSPGAYEKVVDHLLSTQRYAEHQARYWLDVARYGDTHGLHLDNFREMWAYREWVINSFLQNQPYNQFIRDQLAGDLVANASRNQLIATGYNRCHVTTSEGGSIEEEVYVRNVVDQVDTFGTAFLGLTVGCARCHDHKYDPFSMKDYYQLFAYFNSIDGSPLDGNAARHEPVLKVGTPEQLAKLESIQTKILEKKQHISQLVAAIKYEEPKETEKSTSTNESVDYVWIEDAVPSGTKAIGEWKFVKSPEFPVHSGKKSHTSTATGLKQHLIQEADPGLILGQNDTLFANVYLDPNNPPKEIMLQWNTGDWNHRAYWGENKIDWGTDKTGSRQHLGPLPETGKWVRLDVEMEKVGLKPGQIITGWAFTQFDGTVTWDKSGLKTRTAQGKVTFTSLNSWVGHQAKIGAAKLPGPLQKIVKTAADKRTDEQKKELLLFFLENVHPDSMKKVKPLRTEVEKFTKERAAIEATIPATMIFREKKEPRPSYMLKRGEYDQRGDKVERELPSMFASMKTTVRKDRLGLADWLIDPQHPLTTRVAVNRFWQQVFGTGLVKTTEDLGLQGEMPTHAELLDWLAVEFQESGWDVKKLMKLMVMSNTYRQTSKITAKQLAQDPGNRFYSHGPRHRLDAEVMRDQALFVSGLLVEKLGGPSVKPPQPSGLWEAVGYVSSNTANFKADTGMENVHRRSLYTFWKRTAPPPQMSTMDAPSRESCTVRRERTNTPLQALLMLNETQYVECARSLAQRVMLATETSEARIRSLVKAVLCREAEPQEFDILLQVYEVHLKQFQAKPADAEKLLRVGESKADEKLPKPELAAMTMLANIVLNLDETVTK